MAISQVMRVGPAGWSYQDWSGIVYPLRRGRGFHEAAYLADYFDTIEINTSFYQPVRPELGKLWVRKVEHNPRFLFTAKLWHRFTHERQTSAEDELAAREGFDALMAEGKLGAVLMQFPWSFKYDPDNRHYLIGLILRFRAYPLVVEVRHGSWNQPEVYELLREWNVGFCNIDQPVIGRSLKPSAAATSPVGYIRLHGRNYDSWFSEDAKRQPDERYNYLYSAAELQPWAARTRNVSDQTESTFVITNNHYQGKAIANALQLIHLLTGKPVRVPPEMISRYPELESIATPDSVAPGLFSAPKNQAT